MVLKIARPLTTFACCAPRGLEGWGVHHWCRDHAPMDLPFHQGRWLAQLSNNAGSTARESIGTLDFGAARDPDSSFRRVTRLARFPARPSPPSSEIRVIRDQPGPGRAFSGALTPVSAGRRPCLWTITKAGGETPVSAGRRPCLCPCADSDRPASRPRRDPCPPRALPPRSERMRFADPLSPARRPSHAGKRPGCDFAPPPSPAQTRPQSFRSPPPFPRRLPRSPRFIMRTADKSGCVCCGSAVSSRQAAALTRSRASAATQSHGQRFGPKICIYRHPTGCSVCR